MYGVGEGDEGEPEIDIEHRYTIRVDPNWIKDGGIVALELEPPYFSTSTGNRLDTFGSIFEFSLDPKAQGHEISVPTIEPSSTENEGSHAVALNVRCE